MMRLIKQLSTLLICLSMIGTTMLGAMATPYPNPFIENGVFNGNIVVGAQAAATDIVGSIDVGTSLQYAMKLPVGTNGSTEASITDGYKVQKSGDSFNYGDTIESVMDGTALTADDLPRVLSDGKYTESQGDNKNSITYTQELLFKPNNAELKYTQDDDLAPVAGDYLVINENDPLYTYTLEFDSPVRYNNDNENDALDDWKTTTLQIQGKTYTISDISLTHDNGELDKVSFISGEAVMWLTQNQPITKFINGVEHEIQVLDVTEDADACQVKVDDVTSILDVDTTKTINGVQIGITDVRAIHAQLQDQDICQIAVGASEVELQDGRELKVDDVELDGTEVSLLESTGGEFEGFTIDYSAENQDDDTYLKIGQAWTDPVFNSWKIAYAGSSGASETYTLKTAGDENAVFKFINNDGKNIEIPLYYDEDNTWGSNILLGDGNDCEDLIIGDGVTFTGISGVNNISTNDCEGIRVLATTAGGEMHLFELSNIDFGSSSNTTDVKDVTYGRTFDNIKFTTGVPTALNLGSFGTLSVNITDTSINVVDTIKGEIETKAGALIDIDASSLVNKTRITLDEDGIDSDLTPDVLTLDVFKNSDGEIHTTADWAVSSSNVPSKEDSNDNILTSAMGTKVTIDDDGTDVLIKMAKDDVYGNIYIAPITAEVTHGVNGVPLYTLNRLDVGVSKLDTEITNAAAQNLIIVGGPCANRIAAQMMGVPFASDGCAAGFSPSMSIIKSVAQANGKVALVVAGYDALDTRMATRVLANWEDYNLSIIPGNTYILNGTTLSNLKITKSL